MKLNDKIVYEGRQIEDILRLMENIEVKGMQSMKNMVGIHMILSQGKTIDAGKENANGSNDEHC